ncbi:hypothetical protein [Haladaptatus sp. CMAA 1911]|uniref:hypothetical protein n=1 Tax=unclassified Haladaptatus TaxID=2622732 RepID=UPI00375514AB
MPPTNESPVLRARIYVFDYYPDATFQVASKPLAYKPTVRVQEGESFLSEMYWSKYETRIIRYENTNERVLCFPRKGDMIEAGKRYQMMRMKKTKELAKGIVSIEFELMK